MPSALANLLKGFDLNAASLASMLASCCFNRFQLASHRIQLAPLRIEAEPLAHGDLPVSGEALLEMTHMAALRIDLHLLIGNADVALRIIDVALLKHADAAVGSGVA
jgi:hypothetical protein